MGSNQINIKNTTIEPLRLAELNLRMYETEVLESPKIQQNVLSWQSFN